VQLVFLVEAATLSTLGGLAGVGVGAGICGLLRVIVPGLPVHIPLVFVALAVTVSLAIGLAAGVTPARRAALLDPIEALRTE
jgi:putative ABC transport system permease protein